MSKIISKTTYILFLALLLIAPSFASAFVFSAETLSATSITSTSAKLNGTVSFDEGEGTAWFEYGISSKPDKKTDNIELSAGSKQKVSKSISGLSASDKYYFRICFKSSAFYGTACGNVFTFGEPAPVVTTTTTTSTTTTNTNSTSSSSNSSSSNSTSNSNPKSNTVKSETKGEVSSQSASVANATEGGNFLPNTFLEWLVVIVLIFFIVMFGRYLYLKRQEEKEEEEKRRKEELIRAQMA